MQWTLDSPITHLPECVLVRREMGRRGPLVVARGARGVRRPGGHHGGVGVAVGVGGAGHVPGVGPRHKVVRGGRPAGPSAADTDLLTS